MKDRQENGIVLISMMFLIVVLLGLFAAYYAHTRVEIKTTQASAHSAAGFSAAEAALNIRADQLRQTFVGYNRPDGASPADEDSCKSGNYGTGDFACQSESFGRHYTDSWVIDETAGIPISVPVDEGELYEGLDSQQYVYTVRSEARNNQDRVEAILDMRLKSILIPMFQFVAFYNKDLEIAPGPTMNLSGPIHTNGDLFLNSGNSLNIAGQTSTAGELFRGRKNNNDCGGSVKVKDPGSYLAVPSCSGGRTEITEPQVVPWNGEIQIGVNPVTVPEPEALNASPGNIYFDKADLRLILNLDSSNNPITTESITGVEIRSSDNTVNMQDQQKITNLQSCPGSINGRPAGFSSTFFNNREGKSIRMLEVDLQALFNCIYSVNLAFAATDPDSTLMGGKTLADDSEGGLVFHFSVSGPDSSSINGYGVRVRNGSLLQSSASEAPQVKGITIVTNQAFYIAGNYNSNDDLKIPAAFLTDTFNVLSENWNLNDSKSSQSLSNRTASNTKVQAAVLAATDSTGNTEGSGGWGGDYNGGFENYPRFHEIWSGKTFTYRGSFVSLNIPQHVNGNWVYGSPQYKAPNRDWDYDTDFNDASNLPPLSPRFVYLRQELFVRKFEQ